MVSVADWKAESALVAKQDQRGAVPSEHDPESRPNSLLDHLQIGFPVAQEANHHERVRPPLEPEYYCMHAPTIQLIIGGVDQVHPQITSINGTTSPEEVVVISAHQDR